MKVEEPPETTPEDDSILSAVLDGLEEQTNENDDDADLGHFEEEEKEEEE